MFPFIWIVCVASIAAAAETAGCDAGAIRASRLSDNPDYCISCPETDLGAVGVPKIALCTPKASNMDVVSSNNIIVSGVGGETIIVQNRRLLATSLEQTVVSDVMCKGDKLTPIGLKCFYGDVYARNVDPNITDTTGKQFSVEEFNAGISVTSAGMTVVPQAISLALIYLSMAMLAV